MGVTGETGRTGQVRSLLHSHALGAGLAMVVFLGSWVFLGHWFYERHADSVTQSYDSVVYQGYATDIRAGQLPYRDFSLVYPPGGLPVFLIPAYVVSASDVAGYQKWFAREMGACGVLCLLFVLAARPPMRAVAFFALSPLLIGSILLSRFDLWPAALVAGALAAFVRDRHVLGFVALGAAFAAKLFALVLLPVAIIWTLRRAGGRVLGTCLACWTVVVVAAFGPVAVLAPHGLWSSLHDQLSRRIQIESLAGAALTTFGHPVEVTALGAASLRGHHMLAAVLTAVEVTVFVAVWLGFALGEIEPGRLVRSFAACVCAFIAFGKVLSPQYLIWLVPLVPLIRGRRGLLALFLFSAVLVVTQWYYPDHYGSVADFHLAWLVLARDLLLIGLLGVISVPALALLRNPPATRLTRRGAKAG